MSTKKATGHFEYTISKGDGTYGKKSGFATLRLDGFKSLVQNIDRPFALITILTFLAHTFLFMTGEKYKMAHVTSAVSIWSLLILMFMFAMGKFGQYNKALNASQKFRDYMKYSTFHNALFYLFNMLFVLYYTILIFFHALNKDKIKNRIKMAGKDDKYYKLMKVNAILSMGVLILLALLYYMKNSWQIQAITSVGMSALLVLLGLSFKRLHKLIVIETTDG